MKQAEKLVHVDQHVLQFKDSNSKLSGIWTNDPFTTDKGLGTAEGSIWMTDFSRAAGNVPVLMERHSTPPAADDLDDYDGVIEGTLALPSGKMSVENESGTQATVRVSSGTYRARVYYANKDTCRYDYSDGADHARLVLFRAAPGPVRILKPIENEDDPVREYRGERSEAELGDMLGAESTSHRCVAAVALLRLGRIDRVQGALASSPMSMKRVFTSALWFAGARAEPILATLAKDADADIRTRAAQSLGFLKSRGAKRIVAPLVDDEDEWVRDAAEAVLDALA